MRLREFVDKEGIVDGMMMPPEPLKGPCCLMHAIELAAFVQDIGIVFGPLPMMN